MTESISTTEVDRGSQLDYWREAVCATFAQFDLKAPQRSRTAGFHGEITLQDVGAVQLATVTSEPHTVVRSSALIRRADTDDLFVNVMTRGRTVVVQDMREAVLRTGDFAVYDSTRPCRIVCPEPFRMVVVRIPRGAFAARCLPQPQARAMATVVRGDQGVGALVSPFLRTLADQITKLPHDTAREIGAHTLELVSTALSGLADPGPGPGPGQSLTGPIHLRRARRHIGDHLGEPDLTPGTVAAALGLSVRYLHAIFQAEGTSPSRWIMMQRLERAAALLSDPRQAGRGITEIGFTAGFKDATHFARAFRTRYQVSPRQYRREAIALSDKFPCRQDQEPSTPDA